MRRRLLLGFAAIALATAACLAFLAVVTRDGPAPAPAPEPEPAETSLEPEPPPAPLALAPPPLAAAPATPPTDSDPAGTRPGADDDDLPPAARPRDALGPLGPGVARALGALRPQLAACFRRDAEGRIGAARASRIGGRLARPSRGVVLVLTLDARDGEVLVLDAPAVGPGGDEAVIACLQAELRGRSLPVPAARAGGRHRLRYPVVP